jgi:hypothetical protein
MIPLVGIRHGKLRSEEEVADRVLVEDPMDHDSIGVSLEVDPIVLAAETVKGASIPLELGEVCPIKRVEILGENLKLRE